MEAAVPDKTNSPTMPRPDPSPTQPSPVKWMLNNVVEAHAANRHVWWWQWLQTLAQSR